LAELNQRVTTLEGGVAALEDTVSEHGETLVEHRTRLENGTKVFGEMGERLKRLEPRAPDWLKVIGVGIALLAMFVAAQLWISGEFADRPTDSQIDKIVSSHDESGHKDAAKERRAIREEQVAQRAAINALKEEQVKVTKKLDVLLERIPQRRRRPR
jgi:uncharacterized coiled-coil protein SlyX